MKRIGLLVLGAALWGSTLSMANTPVVQSQPVRSGGASAAQVSNNAVDMLFNENQMLREEVTQLRGMVEELSFMVERLRDENRERYIELDERVGALVRSGTSAAATPATGAASAGSAASTPARPTSLPAEVTSGTPQQRYDRARQLLLDRKIPESIFAFQSFINDLPDHALAANAAYWLGEVHALVPDYAAANRAFLLVIGQYPDSPKVPDALYKLGILAELQGQDQQAKVYFKDVVELYPQSQAARLAERKL